MRQGTPSARGVEYIGKFGLLVVDCINVGHIASIVGVLRFDDKVVVIRRVLVRTFR